MRSLHPRLRVLSALAWLLLAVACDGSSPTAPSSEAVSVSVSDPAVAHIGSGDTLCLELPVTIRNLRDDAGGRLESIHVFASERETGALVGENLRPNKDFVFPETTLPPGGTLVAEGKLCYPRPTIEVELVARVRVEVTVFPPDRGSFVVTPEVTVAIVEAT